MGPERCRAELAVEKTTRSISFDGVSVGRYCGVGRLGDAASRRTCCTSRCGCARGYGWRCMQLRCFGKFIVSAPSFYRMYAFMECGSGLDAIRSRRLSFCPFREGGGNCAFASHRRISNKASGREVRAGRWNARLRDADSRHVGLCGYSLCGTARSVSPESFAGRLPRIEYMASAFPVRPPWKGFSSFFSGERAKKL